jgi:hypothetical protein
MASEYVLAESELVAFAKAIRGARDIDDARDKARAAGYSHDDIHRLLIAAQDREFKRKLQYARAL